MTSQLANELDCNQALMEVLKNKIENVVTK